MTRIVNDRLNAATPPFDVVDLVRAVNDCLPPANRFPVGAQNCAIEFIKQILAHLDLQPRFLTTFLAFGSCHVCGYQNEWDHEGAQVLTVGAPQDGSDIDIEQAMTAELNKQVFGINSVCGSQGPCNQSPVVAKPRQKENLVTIVGVDRTNNANHRQKMVMEDCLLDPQKGKMVLEDHLLGYHLRMVL